VKEALIESLLLGMIGKTAKFRKYGRSEEVNSPMNFVLDHIQKEIKDNFDVYWVEGGLPELFSISGIERTPIVYNTRYIELVYLMRRLVGLDELGAFREEVAERTCLRVMGELAVRYSTPEWAIRAFLQSILGEGIRILDIPGVALLDLEAQPINEAYVAIWFFGLAHELGHLKAAKKSDFGEDTFFSSARTLEALSVCLEKFQLPPQIKKDEVLHDSDSRPEYVLACPRLALEAYADFFAMHQIFNTTRLIMWKIGGQFDILRFAQEATLSLALVGILDRCKRIALAADAVEASQSLRDELLLQPISYAVRQLMVRPLLDLEIAGYLSDTIGSPKEQIETSERLVNEISEHWQERIDQVEKGLAKAMRFVLFPAERGHDLMQRFATQASSGLHSLDTRQFCDLIESFHGQNESVDALRRIAGVNN
jgi:hypothetical protein